MHIESSSIAFRDHFYVVDQRLNRSVLWDIRRILLSFEGLQPVRMPADMALTVGFRPRTLLQRYPKTVITQSSQRYGRLATDVKS
jgi:hypothetical protein